MSSVMEGEMSGPTASDIFIGQEKLKYRWLQLEGHRHIEGQRPCLLFSEIAPFTNEGEGDVVRLLDN